MNEPCSRILYGKVRKKGAVHLRDAMFEFLAGCSNADIISFFDMYFIQFSVSVKGLITWKSS